MKKTAGFLIVLFASMFLMFLFYNTVCADGLYDVFGLQDPNKNQVDTEPGKRLTADEFLNQLGKKSKQKTETQKPVNTKGIFNDYLKNKEVKQKLICTITCETI